MNNVDEIVPDETVSSGSGPTESSPLILKDDDEEQVGGDPPPRPPKDEFQLIYFTFFILGLGGLLPFNFFISVNSFWDYKFRNVSSHNHSISSSDEQTDLQKEFTSMLAIASNVPNATFIILNVAFGQKVGLKKRVIGSLGMILVLFLVVTFLAKANSDSWQQQFLVTILLIVVLININSAIFQGGFFGVAGKFPTRYISSAMAGQAVAGIFSTLVDMFITGLHVKPQNIGVICFIIAMTVLLLCMIGFNAAFKSEFFQYYLNSSTGRLPRSQHSTFSKIRVVLASSWQYCLAVFLTFSVTLSVFPAVTVLVESQFVNDPNLEWWARDFFNLVCCFLLFNFGDLIGRCLASWLQMPGNGVLGRNLVVFFSLLRIVFVPLFMYCNASPSRRKLPIYFRNDADFIAFMTFFSLSNGYLGNLCMIHGPKTTNSAELQETTAMVLVACLVLGTGSGSFLSYPITTSI